MTSTGHELDELVSIKITKGAHMFLRHAPTLGIQMASYASLAIINEMRHTHPELYEWVRKQNAEVITEWHQALDLATDRREDGGNEE